jgi:hypothetical protein
MKRFSLCLSLIFLLAISCLAQNSVETKVDEYIRAEMQAQQIPGLALAVIKDGKTVIARGYGLANVEHQVPVKPETIFQSGYRDCRDDARRRREVESRRQDHQVLSRWTGSMAENHRATHAHAHERDD